MPINPPQFFRKSYSSTTSKHNCSVKIRRSNGVILSSFTFFELVLEIKKQSNFRMEITIKLTHNMKSIQLSFIKTYQL